MKLQFDPYIGKAIEVKQDEYHGELIKVRIEDLDTKRTDDQIPYAYPLIPKMLHIKPKKGEGVIVFVDRTGGVKGTQRYYIGPVISQPQKFMEESMSSGVRLLANGGRNPDASIDNKGISNGTMPEDGDVALLGRKNSDVILSDNEVKIRAGVRKHDPFGNTVEFNRQSPAFIKLKYHESPLKSEELENKVGSHPSTKSTATIYADKINLISPSGDKVAEMETGENAGDLIGDEELEKLIQKAHSVPYGDVLCDFLSLFLKMYMMHSHPSPGDPPINGDPESVIFYGKYGVDKDSLENKLLSKDIRIN